MHRSIHSQKFLEKKRKRRQLLLFLSIICLFTVTASFILLLRISLLQIKTITVEGSTLVPNESLASSAISSLSGNYFKIIPRSSSVFFSKTMIEDAVKNNYKEVDGVKIKRSGLTELKLIVNERIPAAVVCAGFREDEDGAKCFWSDSKGYVFGEIAASSTQPDSISHYYVPTTQGEITPGKNFISPELFINLQEFIAGASKAGLYPLGLLIGENGEYEMYIKNEKVDSEITIYFDNRSPFNSTLENLLTFWENTVKNKKSDEVPAFDYINLRFGNTVYYSAN